jgi:hypothetical protein
MRTFSPFLTRKVGARYAPFTPQVVIERAAPKSVLPVWRLRLKLRVEDSKLEGASSGILNGSLKELPTPVLGHKNSSPADRKMAATTAEKTSRERGMLQRYDRSLNAR